MKSYPQAFKRNYSIKIHKTCAAFSVVTGVRDRHILIHNLYITVLSTETIVANIFEIIMTTKTDKNQTT